MSDAGRFSPRLIATRRLHELTGWEGGTPFAEDVLAVLQFEGSVGLPSDNLVRAAVWVESEGAFSYGYVQLSRAAYLDLIPVSTLINQPEPSIEQFAVESRSKTRRPSTLTEADRTKREARRLQFQWQDGKSPVAATRRLARRLLETASPELVLDLQMILRLIEIEATEDTAAEYIASVLAGIAGDPEVEGQ